MESLEGSGKFTIFAVSNRWTVDNPLPLSNFCVLLDCLTGAKIRTILVICKKNSYFLRKVCLAARIFTSFNK